MMFGKQDIVPLHYQLPCGWQKRDILGNTNHIIPVIGDGALTGGMALEALNHIGHDKTDLTIILNDNEMSIARM